jgi:WXG100 family type VII secretion target
MREDDSVTSFEVTAVELQVTGSALNQISSDSRTALTSLRADVESLLGGSWSGAAASQFRAGWEEWQAAATDALVVLDEMGSLLSANGRDYTSSDTSGGTVLRNSSQGL